MSSKDTAEKFIKAAKIKHGDKYDYSNVSDEYVNLYAHITIQCPIHGKIKQTPYGHLKSYGCKKCGLNESFKSHRQTKEEFIEKAKKIHGDLYDYSEMDYDIETINAKTKVKIICKTHGAFYQTRNVHISHEAGCPKCGCEISYSKIDFTYEDFTSSGVAFEDFIKKSKELKQQNETEEFVQKLKKKFGDKYDYSKTKYVTNRDKVIVICPIHGEFLNSPTHLLREGRGGCQQCNSIIRGKKRCINRDELIKKAITIHGDKYIYDKIEDYDNHNSFVTDILITIICRKHGEFQIKRTYFLCGHGCKICGEEYSNECNKSRAKSFNDFVENATKIHGNNLNFDKSKLTYETRKSKIIVTCNKYADHGDFETIGSSIISGHGCKKCNQSFGEREIYNYLTVNNINFVTQKRFSDCRNTYTLPFDFYIESKNLCVEFDGEQHFRPVKRFGGEEEFKKLQERDNIKTNYCEKNNIHFLRLTYKDLDDGLIQNKLDDCLKNINNIKI